MLAVYLYNRRYSFKEALCLGFLTVFLNSYYWELPLHMAEVLSGTLHVGMLVQLWRLVPVPFFLGHYRFTDRRLVSLGLGFSFVILCLKYALRILPVRLMLYAVNRLVCLLILTKTIIEAEPKIQV
jgi:hypothetical protein